MEIKKENIEEHKNLTKIYGYSRRMLRIVVSSLVGIVAGIGMFIVYIFWSMHFISELLYIEKSSIPIFTTFLQAIFLLGPQIISGFISTNIKKALITGIIVAATIGTIFVLFNILQGIISVIVIISGNYFGGYLAEH
ncbi:MAG: hypothetical protein ACTSRG_14040 [Candidatus Helarchaeota archaeon]